MQVYESRLLPTAQGTLLKHPARANGELVTLAAAGASRFRHASHPAVAPCCSACVREVQLGAIVVRDATMRLGELGQAAGGTGSVMSSVLAYMRPSILDSGAQGV